MVRRKDLIGQYKKMVRPRELIGRYRNMVCRKDLIGWYGNMVSRRALIGQYRKMVRKRSLIGRYRKMVRRRLWLVRMTCWSCQSNLIGRSDLLSSGAFNWFSCFATSYSGLLTTRKRYAKCFLFRHFRQWFKNNKKRYAKCDLFCDEHAVQSAVAHETDKTTVTFVLTYSTRGWVLKLCTMLNDGAQ